MIVELYMLRVRIGSLCGVMGQCQMSVSVLGVIEFKF